jgi:ketosteroid isomerase-like protein
MSGALNRVSASPVLATFRRYVTDFVNRHDFSSIHEFMADDYTLDTSGLIITGRDGPYQAAVASQLRQFPGLIFTPHELFHSGDAIGIRFTEHGASPRHDGRLAAWPTIAIYRVRDGKLDRCALEQDYFSRRRQLATGIPVPVDGPATAPWDTVETPANSDAEKIVGAWLSGGAFLCTAGVQIDDANATGVVEAIVADGAIEMLEIASGGDKVAFHAAQTGTLADDFGAEFAGQGQTAVTLHMSGLVTVAQGHVVRGNIIRDRWGLYRRLAAAL